MKNNYAIMRIAKHGNMSGAGGLLDHHLRLDEVLNADPKKKDENEILFLRGDNGKQGIIDFLNDVPKGSLKNSTRFVDCVFTASRFDDKKHFENWKKETEKFVKKTFGADNIALMVVHKDETTPHMHVIFKPVNPKTKKLGAGYWFDGVKKMKDIQTQYFKSVEHLGFDRGLTQERAKHTTIKSFYSAINKNQKRIEKEANELKKALNEVQSYSQKKSFFDLFNDEHSNNLNIKMSIVYKHGRSLISYQQHNNVEELKAENEKLNAENKLMKEKLLKITGITQPTLKDIQNHIQYVKSLERFYNEKNEKPSPKPEKPTPEPEKPLARRKNGPSLG